MKVDFVEATLARIPAVEIHLLAPLRCMDGVGVAARGDDYWVKWSTESEEVIHCLLPIAGVQFFVENDNGWRCAGRYLPAFDIPNDLSFRPLSRVLLPCPFDSLPPAQTNLDKVALRLAPDQLPRLANGMVCSAPELRRWADTVPSARLAKLQGVRCDDRVFVIGERLPFMRQGTRYWGNQVLLPLGFRLEPQLPESAVAAALGVAAREIVLIDEQATEIIPRDLLQPLTRAALKLITSCDDEPGK